MLVRNTKSYNRDIESTDGLSHYDNDVDCQHFKVAVNHLSPCSVSGPVLGASDSP